jgi:hypothetical protein
MPFKQNRTPSPHTILSRFYQLFAFFYSVIHLTYVSSSWKAICGVGLLHLGTTMCVTSVLTYDSSKLISCSGGAHNIRFWEVCMLQCMWHTLTDYLRNVVRTKLRFVKFADTTLGRKQMDDHLDMNRAGVRAVPLEVSSMRWDSCSLIPFEND